MEVDKKYMARALDLAKLGLGSVAPNPLVGAVIVHHNRIIGEGYHRYYGGPHAEVNAINSVEDQNLLSDAILYVNLEPCNHSGLTPPCTDLILKHSIPGLVVGQADPNPVVAGRGLQRLKQNGVEIVPEFMMDESREVNRRFNTFHEKKRPFVILKWAQTADGFVDKIRVKTDPIEPNWITDDYCRQMVHKWRSEEAAIMVGTETAWKDNPKLNLRLWSGKDPLRIVLDQHLRLPENLNLFDRTIPTLVYTGKRKVSKENLEYVQLEFDDRILHLILEDLYRKSIQSLIVEGGSGLLNSFIKSNLWDEARVFTGPVEFDDGVKAPHFPYEPIKEQRIATSKLEIYRNNDE